MTNIYAITPTGKKILVENKVSKAAKALAYWKEWGMSFCKYVAESDRDFTPKNLQ